MVLDRVDVNEANRILNKSEINHRIIRSHKPGIVAALNLGLEKITSEFVARMDEDDVMLPERLELQYEYLRRNKEVLAVGGQLSLIDIEGRTIGQAGYLKKIKLSSHHLFEKSPIAHPAVMFRRESVNRVGGYRDFLPEDWDLWVRLREVGPVHNLKEVVLKYRVHPGQLSRQNMYANSYGKLFVASSHFARQESLLDHPKIGQDSLMWLLETQSELRKTSRRFRKFERHSKFIDALSRGFKKSLNREQIKILFMGFFQSPIALTKYLTIRAARKVKLKFYKSICST